MSSEFGRKLKVRVFGRSHGECIGVEIEGFPRGIKIDFDALYAFMERRKGGKDQLSTARKEADRPEFLSGVENGVTTGDKIKAVIYNNDARSKDYADLALTPRPAHADYTAHVKWHGSEDMRGGGKFSGRLTAPICIAGALAKQALAQKGVYVGAHALSVGTIKDDPFPLAPTKELFDSVATKVIPAINDDSAKEMEQLILKARSEEDSVGGVVECAVIGVKAGLGDALFDGVESRIAPALFGVPGVKGVEFGSGFYGSTLKGSENNDPFVIEDGCVKTHTNNAGGILGGITSGMPIVVKAAMKPTPSIGKEQTSIRLDTMEQTTVSIKGRHDPCIALRAVPVIEAVCALVTLDMYEEEN